MAKPVPNKATHVPTLTSVKETSALQAAAGPLDWPADEPTELQIVNAGQPQPLVQYGRQRVGSGKPSAAFASAVYQSGPVFPVVMGGVQTGGPRVVTLGPALVQGGVTVRAPLAGPRSGPSAGCNCKLGCGGESSTADGTPVPQEFSIPRGSEYREVEAGCEEVEVTPASRRCEQIAILYEGSLTLDTVRRAYPMIGYLVVIDRDGTSTPMGMVRRNRFHGEIECFDVHIPPGPADFGPIPSPYPRFLGGEFLGAITTFEAGWMLVPDSSDPFGMTTFHVAHRPEETVGLVFEAGPAHRLHLELGLHNNCYDAGTGMVVPPWMPWSDLDCHRNTVTPIVDTARVTRTVCHPRIRGARGYDVLWPTLGGPSSPWPWGAGGR